MITIIFVGAFIADLPTIIIAVTQLVNNLQAIWWDFKAFKLTSYNTTGLVNEAISFPPTAPAADTAIELSSPSNFNDNTVAPPREPDPPDPKLQDEEEESPDTESHDLDSLSHDLSRSPSLFSDASIFSKNTGSIGDFHLDRLYAAENNVVQTP